MSNGPQFAEIGIRSNFSFLEGASHPEELAVAARRLGLAGITSDPQAATIPQHHPADANYCLRWTGLARATTM